MGTIDHPVWRHDSALLKTRTTVLLAGTPSSLAAMERCVPPAGGGGIAISGWANPCCGRPNFDQTGDQFCLSRTTIGFLFRMQYGGRYRILVIKSDESATTTEETADVR